MDITDDDNTLTMDVAEILRKGRDPRLKYYIGERQMFSSYPSQGFTPWTWRPYSGINAHTRHSHLSVQPYNYDDTSPWGIYDAPVENGDDVLSQAQNAGEYDRDVLVWQYRLNQLGYNIAKDGYYGPVTAGAVNGFQDHQGLEVTGVVNLTTAVQLQAQAHLAMNHG